MIFFLIFFSFFFFSCYCLLSSVPSLYIISINLNYFFSFIGCREIRDLFSETVQIKNPCTSSERRKIVNLAKERIIEEYGFCFDGNFDYTDHSDNSDSDNDNNNNNDGNDNNSNTDNITIDNDINPMNTHLNNIKNKNNNIYKISSKNKNQKNISGSIGYFFDDETVSFITDSLTGYPVYSLYLEAILLLKKTINFKILEYTRNKKNEKIELKNSKFKKSKDRKPNSEMISISTCIENNIEKKDTGNDGLSLSFPLVYGQKMAKKALTEAILWPRKLSSLYRTLCPSGTYDKICIVC
jgi:hypothetical protein